MTTAKVASGSRRLTSAIGLKIGAEGLGRAAQFGTLALAARALTLPDFGRYGLALTVGFLLAQLADFGLHLSVTRRLSRDATDDFAGRALTTKLGLMAGLAGLAGLLAPGLAGSNSGPFWGLAVSALLYGLAEFAFAVLRAQNRLSYEAGLVVFHRLSLLVGAALTFVTGSGLVGLMLAHLVAGGFVAMASWQLVGLRPAGRFEPRLLKTTAPIGLALFLSLLAFKVDVPLLQWLDGRADEVGLYNAAYRLFEPVLLFPAAIMAGLFPGLARAGQQAGFGRQASRLTVGLAGSGLLAALGLIIVAPWIVPLLYGPAYAPAAPTLQLLAFAVPFLFVNSGLTHLVLALDRERYNLYFFAGALALNVTTNWLLIPAFARNGAALATILTEAGLTALCGITLLVVLRPDAPRSVAFSTGQRLGRLGFGGLLTLTVALPFEFNQWPWLNLGGWLTLNNLKLIFYAVVLTALATLWQARKASISGAMFHKWRWPGWWLLGLLLVCALSTVFSVVPKESLKFTVDLALGAILWLALPLWFTEHRITRLRWLQVGLVGGATVSAGLGLLEFWPGLHINDWLLWPFKAGATIAGPFVRLSGTFEYANIAAMYYEMALPFALAELIRAFTAPVGALSRREPDYTLPTVSGLAEPLSRRDGRSYRGDSVRRWLVGAVWLVAVGVLIEAILLTFSRAALPGLLVVGPLMLWGGRKEWRRWRSGFGLATGLAVVLIGLSLLISPTLVLRFKSESDQAWYRADFSSTLPSSLPACGEVSLPVTVHNATPVDWTKDTYQLAYHWLDLPGHIYLFNGVRTELPPVVKAGQSVPVTARLVAPARPGAYLLAWDIVQEADNTNWFSLRSAVYQTQSVDITAGTATCTDPPQTLASLPTTPANPERGQLWRVALKMIGARPWLGVGPDGYRFAYGQYAGQSTWDTRIFANSTPLELAADLGIAGAFCFFLFLGACVWSLLKRGWVGRLGLTEAVVGAALAAFALHGLLDYFLGFHAIFLLLWILLALAWMERDSA